MRHKISTLLKHPPIPWSLVILVAALVLWLFWLFMLSPQNWYAKMQEGVSPIPPAIEINSLEPVPQGPPWIYGKPDARYTLIEYGDLECPFCRAYFPILRQWIDANPEVNWQWHHLPLPAHEPAATHEAKLAECAGELGGHEAFWDTLNWIYALSAANGEGIPDNILHSDMLIPLDECLDSKRPGAVIQAQVQEAAKDNITATPTLRLVDHQSGKTLLLPGPVDGDALLSAIDLLSAPATQGADPSLEE